MDSFVEAQNNLKRMGYPGCVTGKWTMSNPVRESDTATRLQYSVGFSQSAFLMQSRDAYGSVSIL